MVRSILCVYRRNKSGKETDTGDHLSYDGYTLVFEDHFDGAELNRDNWNVELHEPGWVNEEWQRYVDCAENICLRDGRLLIRPVKSIKPDGSISYTSGRISTEHKHNFTYPNATTDFENAVFAVDYVRVYQKQKERNE